MLTPKELPREACWTIVAKYFCKKGKPDMWAASTLQKSTARKDVNPNEEHKVAILREFIDQCKNL